MAHQLTEYLKELPQSTVVQLFSMRHAVLVVYRLLCPLSQYLIRRLMFVDGGTPFDHLRTWQINECRGKQSVALLDLKRLYILEGKSGCVWLNATFRSSLIDAFNLGVYTDLKPCVKCVSEPKRNLEERMDDDWWKMNVLLRLVTGEVDDFNPGLRLVLESAGFLSSEVGDGSGVNPANEKNVNTRRSTSVRRGGSITSEGFRFLLSERSFQILRLLIQYLRMQNSDSDRCTFLDHLLRVALSSVCACVELASIRDADLMILKSLGLVKSGCTASKVNISDLGATLLGGEISLAQRISSSLIGAEKDKSLQKSRKSVSELDIESFNKVHRMGHIVVETNYRIYAYTKCPLEMAIISLFARIRGRFPNLIHGALTGPSVQAAYEQGITATQLVEYINSNFHHPNASANVSSGDEKRNTNVFKSSDDNSGARNNRLPAVVEDQLHLWEHDLCRLKKRPSYLYQHFSDETMFLRVVDEANRLGAGVYVNRAKRLLIVDEGSHDAIKAFIKAG